MPCYGIARGRKLALTPYSSFSAMRGFPMGPSNGGRALRGLSRRGRMSALKLLADAFHEGGWPMWPILLLMVICWGITIERIIYLKKAGIDKEKLLALLKSQIMAGNVQGALQGCSGDPPPPTPHIHAGLP